MDKDAKLIPLVKIADREFLIDVESRVFRDYEDPDTVIKMHSLAGRELLEKMKDADWYGMGISTGRRDALGV